MESLSVEKQIEYIRKRDGRIVPFNQEKITKAIFNAAKAVGGHNKKQAELLTQEIIKIINQEYQQSLPEVEDIQDIVEKELIEKGHAKTAKAYILYRAERKEIRKQEEKKLDCEEVKKLKELNIQLSKQSVNILNGSQQLDELGRAVFLDRYSVKSKKEDVGVGDLLVVVTKEDPKYPKKDIGIVKKILRKDSLLLHMITGVHADK